MQKTLKQLIIITILSILTVSCQQIQEESTTASLTLSFRNSPHQKIELYTLDLLTFQPQNITEIILDKNGTGKAELQIDEPQIVILKQDQDYSYLYLAPGYDLKLSRKDKASGENLLFNGKGAQANAYHQEILAIRKELEKAEGKFFFQLPLDEFLERVNTLEEKFADLNGQYTDNPDITAQSLRLLKQKTNIIPLNWKLNYKLVHSQDSRVQTTQALHAIDQNIPIDTEFFNLKDFEYAQLLIMAQDIEKNKHFERAKSPHEGTEVNKHDRVKLYQSIQQAGTPDNIMEYQTAFNLKASLSEGKLSEADNTLFQEFKKKYPKSEYLPFLETEYNKLLSLSEGSPAPEFTGITPKGKPFSLSELKGKLVYVDVWATWCAPCLKAFPHSKNLQERFKGNDELVFLYVSVDEDKKAWQKKIESGELPKGLHLIEDDQDATIRETYGIVGVPRYMLIDKQGNIIDTDAPGPDTKEIVTQLNQLLSHEVTASK